MKSTEVEPRNFTEYGVCWADESGDDEKEGCYFYHFRVLPIFIFNFIHKIENKEAMDL